MSKIKFEKLRDAVIKTTNSVDSDRTYDIEANVRIINEDEVSNVDSGVVRKGEVTVCTFSTYSQGQMNTNFQNVTDVMEMCSILQSINSFVIDVTSEVAKGEAVSLN